MDVNESVLVPHRDESIDVHTSTMVGKHQRNLSLSAKWASNKAMAFEYLRRQREVMTWIESVLKRELPTANLFEELKSGVVLREMMETLYPDASNCMSPISRSYSLRMGPWKERENISVFLRQCKSIGMNNLSLFCTDDLYEGTNIVQVLFCVQHFMMFSEERMGHLHQPVVTSEPAIFSNQELEMAMSKIEQAGVDVKAFQGMLLSNTSSVMPASIAAQTKEVMMRASEPVVMSPMEEQLERTQEELLIANEEFVEGKISAYVLPEVYNQMSENKLDIVNPADEDDLNPAQESESDAGDEEVDAQAEGNPVTERDLGFIGALPVDYRSMLDEETLASIHTMAVIKTMAIIKQVLSNLVTTIMEIEPQTQLTLRQTKESQAVNTEPSKDVNGALEAQEITEDTKSQVCDGNTVTNQPENPGAKSTDAPVETPTVDKAANTTLRREIAEERIEDGPQPAEEELEVKAMAKCTCGRCTIM